MTVDEVSGSSTWSREDDIAFENALVNHLDETEDRWEKIAADVPGKTPDQIKGHYELLVEDINSIESGRVPLPAYSSPEGSNGHVGDGGGTDKKGGGDFNHGGGKSKTEQERRKGIAWTEEEHRLFLLGLDKYGKGDWRSISRNFVVTRTPTQVASHAQKYFIRLNSLNKDRRRSSIHDITSIRNGDISSPQGQLTGQNNDGRGTVSAGTSSTNPPKQTASQQSPVSPTYGIGQPVGGGGPLVSAVGTPVNLPAPPHMAYGVRAPPIPGSVVPGAPMNLAPLPYPMPHTPTTHR
ncbi:PREDICTED: transcription factor DIVARICATA-like isoform X2 [Tarenaya hassleriana]|uniref:transcription factor DIVARICATA-like isoform X2 n=1 Tax=Tarenaya hassleriana TaxID=28532 RepID=UPI00053C58D4|nr:PREDICTED: transcription factor DIVARICATA-like isoform X2 [Tarenaya hassleriana]